MRKHQHMNWISLWPLLLGLAGQPLPKHLRAYIITHNAPGNLYKEGRHDSCNVLIDFVDTSLILVGSDSFHIINRYEFGEMNIAYSCMCHGQTGSISIAAIGPTKYRIVAQYYQDSMNVYEASAGSKPVMVESRRLWKLHLYKEGEVVHFAAESAEHYFGIYSGSMAVPAEDERKWNRFDSTLVLDTTSSQWVHFDFDPHGIHYHRGRRIFCYQEDVPHSNSTLYEFIFFQKGNRRRKFYQIDMKTPWGLVRHFLAREEH